MSVNPQENVSTEQQKLSDKEINFRKQEEMFKRQLEQERQARLQAEAKAAELEKSRSRPQNDDDDEEDDNEPYIDKRKLKRELGKVVKQTKTETQSEIQQAVQQALASERRQNWLKQNSDFQEVMSYAQKFAETDPELAETILEMPDSFERQKLVYKNIKALGLHKPEEKKPSIQDTIDKNRRNPYYQPSGIGAAPYNGMQVGGKDYSQGEQKNAYDKMKELQAKLRL